MSTISAAEPATSLLAMQADGRQNELSLIMVKKQAEQEAAVIALLDDVQKSAPPPAPPGQGLILDRFA